MVTDVQTRLRAYRSELRREIESEDWFSRFVRPRITRGPGQLYNQHLSRLHPSSVVSFQDLPKLATVSPVLVIGDVGAGKSTCLHRVAHAATKKRRLLPVVVNFDPNAPIDVEQAIDLSLTQRDFGIDDMLRCGLQPLVIADQLNDFGARQSDMLAELERTMINLDGFLIAATRSSSLASAVRTNPRFSVFEIRPLLPPDILRFMAEIVGDPAADLLWRSMDSRLRGVSSNPLILQMIAANFEKNQRVPSSRTGLYAEFLSDLLHYWDGTRRRVSAAFLDDALATLARHLDPTVETHSISEFERGVVKGLERLNRKYGQDHKAHEVFEDVSSCAIVRPIPRAARMSFLHQSMQEYFAAVHLNDELGEGESTLGEVVALVDSPGWLEPLFFLSGLLDDASPLVRLLIAKRRLLEAAEFVANAKHVPPELVESLVVDCLDTFKFTDYQLSENEVVAYRIIAALERLLSAESLRGVSRRLVEDVTFFVDKYLYTVSDHGSGGKGSHEDDEEILATLAAREFPALMASMVRSLARRGGQSGGVDDLRALAASGPADQRDAAIFALGEVGTADDTDTLLSCIAQVETPQVVVAASNALIRQHLRGAYQSNDETWSRVVGHLSSAMDSLAFPSREQIAWALFNVAPEIASHVLPRHISTGRNKYHRAMCIYLVAELKLQHMVAPLITRLAVERSAHVREDIVNALGMLVDPLDEEQLGVVTQTLVEVLADPDGVVRMYAVRGLAKCGAEAAREKVRPLLQDPCEYVVREVKRALGHLQQQGDSFMTPIEHELVELQAKLAAHVQAQRRIERLMELSKIDATEYLRLCSGYEQQRLELLADLHSILSGTPELGELTHVVEAAQAGASDDEVFGELERVAQSQSWSRTAIEKIKEKKSEVVGLIITLALEAGRRLG